MVIKLAVYFHQIQSKSDISAFLCSILFCLSCVFMNVIFLNTSSDILNINFKEDTILRTVF